MWCYKLCIYWNESHIYICRAFGGSHWPYSSSMGISVLWILWLPSMGLRRILWLQQKSHWWCFTRSIDGRHDWCHDGIKRARNFYD
ncbi:unnamed protein product [Cylicocyclus nassatus]|uniref:Uncharacterized protein n=1 Tax=Cylicocyclus nassatus TaxID=53992 RepID=A0AA36H4E6_CYLNA|nr:unnamed protein product [Cylicocyclus nassatus]